MLDTRTKKARLKILEKNVKWILNDNFDRDIYKLNFNTQFYRSLQSKTI